MPSVCLLQIVQQFRRSRTGLCIAFLQARRSADRLADHIYPGGDSMNHERVCSKVAVGTLVSILAIAFVVPGIARDRSGVLKASDLIGTKVEGVDGKNLGSIKDLVIDPERGDIQYAVLDFGGFAGIGDKYFAVPWQALQVNQDKKRLALDLHKKDLKDAPGFDKNNWPDLSEQQVVIYEFYEVPAPSEERTARSVQ
jgi:sporulation protein YlmC with PRC-barrel domain